MKVLDRSHATKIQSAKPKDKPSGISECSTLSIGILLSTLHTNIEANIQAHRRSQCSIQVYRYNERRNVISYKGNSRSGPVSMMPGTFHVGAATIHRVCKTPEISNGVKSTQSNN